MPSRASGEARGGGRGPGEVLRPCKPRHPDRPAAQTHRRSGSDPAGAGVPERRNQGWRGGGRATPGHGASRTAVTAVGQCAAGRSGQGAGGAGLRLRPWAPKGPLRGPRRRLQRVRGQHEGRTARDGTAVPRLSRPQTLEPPGADPQAGWCGRGASCDGGPDMPSKAGVLWLRRGFDGRQSPLLPGPGPSAHRCQVPARHSPRPAR